MRKSSYVRMENEPLAVRVRWSGLPRTAPQFTPYGLKSRGPLGEDDGTAAISIEDAVAQVEDLLRGAQARTKARALAEDARMVVEELEELVGSWGFAL